MQVKNQMRIDFIKTNCNNLTAEKIAEELNITSDHVRGMGIQLGLNIKTDFEVRNQQRFDFVKNNHQDYTAFEISEILDVNIDLVYSICRALAVKTKPDSRIQAKNFKQQLHYKINRPEAVYNNSPSPYGIADMFRGIKLAGR